MNKVWHLKKTCVKTEEKNEYIINNQNETAYEIKKEH
jgi:hypothetical protein